MTHLFLTGKLLSESTFLPFISKVNEDFIALDTAEYEFLLGRSQSFELSTSAWVRKCNDSKTVRMENGVMQPFKEYALNRLKALIKDDLNEFIPKYQTGKIADTTRLLEELEIIQGHVSSASYLLPVSKELLSTLSTVEADIESIEKIENIVSQNDGEDFLVWNGPINTLCNIFHDLRNLKPQNGRKVYLDYLPQDLMKFVMKHFRDEKGEALKFHSVKKYLDPTNTDKKPRRNRIIIRED